MTARQDLTLGLPPPPIVIVIITITADDEQSERHTEEAYRQICVADRILLNKTDLVGPEALLALEGDLRALNGMARLRRTEFSRVDLDFVLGLDCYGQMQGRGGEGNAVVPSFLVPAAVDAVAAQEEACDQAGPACTHQHQHQHTREVTTLALVEPGLEVDLDRLRRWLGELLWQEEEEEEEEQEGEKQHRKRATEIYRMKGTVAAAGSDAVHILQAVHETFEVEPSRSLAWGEGEARECRVVVIGRGLDAGALRRGLVACAAAAAAAAEEEEEEEDDDDGAEG